MIFSDEKKFNLDGPDGYQYYWHDLRKDQEIYSKRVQGGGGVMIWAAFARNGKTNLAFITQRMNSIKYQQVLSAHLLSFGPRIADDNFVFMQDNAPVHSSASTKAWFSSKNINVMKWPSLSPDLNPIENLWGILSRKVYQNGRQFSSVEQLKTAIIECWEEIPLQTLGTLIDSMKNRVFEVILNKGNAINY